MENVVSISIKVIFDHQIGISSCMWTFVLTSKKSPEVVLRTCSHNGTDGRQPENTMPLGTTIAVRRQNNVWDGAHIISEDNL